MEDLQILFNPEALLAVYAAGMFPMAPDKESEAIYWYAPDERGIIPLADFHISKNVRRWIRNNDHQVTVNQHFEQVMQACAARTETWISPNIIKAYTQLHMLGHAHSVEVWQQGELVAGLYGVHLKGAFFGESMFKHKPDMDKVALYYCHNILQKNGFQLWDTQYYTRHLGTMGCQPIPQTMYLGLLDEALSVVADFQL